MVKRINIILLFLQQYLIVLCAYVQQFIIWMLDGIGHFLPPSLRSKGWKPYIQEKNINDGSVTLLERSFFGAIRKVKANIDHRTSSSLMVERFVIDHNDIYITGLTLPNSRQSKINRTISLRLEDLSPLLPKEIAFASKIVSKIDDNRLRVDVAMIKKEHIAQVTQLSSDPSYVEITSPQEKRVQFTFQRKINPNKTINYGLFSLWGAVAVSISIFFIGVNVFLAREQAGMKDYEQRLITTIKAEKRLQKRLTVIRNDNLTLRPALNINDLNTALHRFEQKVPPQAFLQAADIEKNSVTANGYISTEIDINDFDNLISKVTLSKRPGVKEVTFMMNSESNP